MKLAKKHLKKWHRRIGITIAIFLLNLSITGIILNHYEILSLHKKMITSSWLLDWYDVKYPQDIRCMNLNKNKLCDIDNSIYLINKNLKVTALIHELGKLINIHQTPSEIIVITSKGLVIFDADFILVDSINLFEEIFSYITTSAYQNNKLFLQSENQYLEVDLNSMDIDEVDFNDWPSVQLPQTNLYHLQNKYLKLSIGQAYRQKQISQLKFIQDLHSGQLFFKSGKFLTDLVAILTIFLVISSLITWQRRKVKTN